MPLRNPTWPNIWSIEQDPRSTKLGVMGSEKPTCSKMYLARTIFSDLGSSFLLFLPGTCTYERSIFLSQKSSHEGSLRGHPQGCALIDEIQSRDFCLYQVDFQHVPLLQHGVSHLNNHIIFPLENTVLLVHTSKRIHNKSPSISNTPRTCLRSILGHHQTVRIESCYTSRFPLGSLTWES